jgi:hypothetical protein
MRFNTIVKILKYPLLSLFFFMLTSVNLKAQVRSFAPDPEVFIVEFVSFVQQYGRKDVADKALKFQETWNQQLYSPAEKKVIRDIANSMVMKNLTVEPYFDLYIGSLNYYLVNNLNKGILSQWQSISELMLKKTPKDYLAFLNTTYSLFSENILESQEGVKWYANNNQFSLLYDGRIAISFKALDLNCDGFLDKIRIENTSGVYYPEKKEWVGSKGVVNWQRVGLTPAQARCELKNYTINLGTVQFTADSALLIYPEYFKGKVLGRFSEKMSNSTDIGLIQKSSYPRFLSYTSNVQIDNLVGDEAIYKGGFSLHGNSVTGESANGEPATITLLFKNKPQVVLRSTAFKIKEGSAASQNSSLEILLDSGRSISHPNIIVNYNFANKKLVVTRGEDGYMRMPFQDTYHELEINVDQIIWDQKLPYVDFKMFSPDKAAIIESREFFREFLYEKMQGILQYNPLYKMRDFALKTKLREFTFEDYLNYHKTKREYMASQIIELVDNGFITYNKENDSIKITNKLFNYVSNYMRVRDYDVIRLSSVIEARPNLSLNLNNKDMKIEGVRRFTYSDSQNVFTVPTEQQVVVRHDRTMIFGGLVRAGRIDFYSSSFTFDYNGFKIGESEIDSMVIHYPDADLGRLRKVESVLTNLLGTIEIDHPGNKSGLKKAQHPDYPIFTSKRGGKVHYEYQNTHNFAYSKETFYFEVDPFTIKRLNDFTIDDLKLSGTFVSDGIFPEFRHEISIMPDYSLGFETSTPPGGYPMYRGKGKGEMVMNLSNKGLYGNGHIEYLGSKTVSNNFLLLPKEARSPTESFDLPESAQYPLVAGRNVVTRWTPYDDKMFVTQEKDPFKVFRSEYDFSGTLILTPKALRGNGELAWNEAEFFSTDMVYGKNRVDADTSGIRIFPIDPNRIAFQTQNVEAHIDFDKRLGHFISNVSDNYTVLPDNKYITSLSDYKWKMDPKMIEMRPNPKFPSHVPLFISIHTEQDSLQFESKFADLDMNEAVVYLEKIPHIDVADSRVFPFEGKAIIRRDADMDRLDSSIIVANRIDKFHTIENCQTKISARSKLNANGYYKYVRKDKTESPIFLDSIRIDIEKHLVGVGNISEEEGFTVDTKIGYKGFAKIISTEQPIAFTGFIKPMHSFTYVPTQWIRYVGYIDPHDVIVEVIRPQNAAGRSLETGLFVAQDSAHIYPLLFDVRGRYSDPVVTKDSGVFYYDHKQDAFVVGHRAKLFDKEEQGNFIVFSEKDKSIFSEGRYELSLNVKDGFKAGFGGIGLMKEEDTNFLFDWTFFMDFPLPKEAVQHMVDLAKRDYCGTPVSVKTTPIIKAASEFYPTIDEAKALVARIKNTGNFNTESIVATSPFFEYVGELKDQAREIFDPNLYIRDVMKRAPEKSMFVVANSQWYFERKENTFINVGKVDIASINGVNINKTFDATFAVKKKRSGDEIHLYIEFSPNDWVYFNYIRGIMYAISSDEKFNQVILDKGQKISNDTYSLRRGTARSMDRFFRKFE